MNFLEVEKLTSLAESAREGNTTPWAKLPPYAIIDNVKGDHWEEFFWTQEDAINAAEVEWHNMHPNDKKARGCYFVSRITWFIDDFDELAYQETEIIKRWK